MFRSYVGTAALTSTSGGTTTNTITVAVPIRGDLAGVRFAAPADNYSTSWDDGAVLVLARVEVPAEDGTILRFPATGKAPLGSLRVPRIPVAQNASIVIEVETLDATSGRNVYAVVEVEQPDPAKSPAQSMRGEAGRLRMVRNSLSLVPQPCGCAG